MKRLSREYAIRLIVIMSLLFSVAEVTAGEVLDRIRETRSVTLGYRPSSLPFSYKSTDTHVPFGYSIDVCHALVEAIQKQLGPKPLSVTHIPISSTERLPLVISGKIDFECGNSTNTKARREKVAFSMPLYYASAKLLVREGAPIDKLDDLAGKTLTALPGTTGMQIAEAHGKHIRDMRVLVSESQESAVAAVEAQRADAFIYDDIVLYGYKAQSKAALAVVGPVMSIEPLAIMFSKQDAELAALVNNEMSRMTLDGRLRRLYKKWFQSPLPQRNFSLNVAPNHLTADALLRPSNFVADWVIL